MTTDAVPVTTAVVAVPVAPRQARGWRAVIDDWYDNGVFDGDHDCAAVREAAERLLGSGPHYSSVYEDIADHANVVCAEPG